MRVFVVKICGDWRLVLNWARGCKEYRSWVVPARLCNNLPQLFEKNLSWMFIRCSYIPFKTFVLNFDIICPKTHELDFLNT